MSAPHLSTFALPGGGEGRRYGPEPTAAPAANPAPLAVAALPAWTVGLAPEERPGRRPASPSSLDEDDSGSVLSPLVQVWGLGRYRRGELIHRLLQLLPDLTPSERDAGARCILAREPGLDDAQREEMAAAALAVLSDPQFAAVFGPGSRAEVPLVGGAAGLPDDLAVSGRVDRLVVESERVLVVDFKTNRPAPLRIEDADPSYVLQMAIYAAVLAEIFPDKAIEAALVWTDGPSLMPVPEGMMRAALAELS